MNKYRLPDKSKGLVENCKGSVVLFSELMLGIKLRSWQVFFLKKLENSVNGLSPKRKFAAITSRQVGKSWAVAIFALWLLVFNKYNGGGVHGNTQVGIVSASDDQAKKLLREVKRLIIVGDIKMEAYKSPSGESLFPKGKDNTGFFSKLLDKHQPNNTTTITFESYREAIHGDFLLKDSKIGSYMVSLPPTGGILGYTFSLLLIDEAGFSKKITDEFFIDYADPTTNVLDAITIYTSTPWQPSGIFYETIKNADAGDTTFDTVSFTIECVKIDDPEYYANVMKKIELMKKSGLNDSVRRSYYCEFVRGELSYFNPDKVSLMFDDTESMVESYEGLCDMGVDFGGQVKSKTVITISKVDDDGHVTRLYHKSYPVGKDMGLIDDMTELLTEFNVQRIIPDDCPAGDYLIRIMRDEKGWNVTPMKFRTDKVKKYGAFRSMLNKGLIHSYVDTDLLVEMMALENSQSSQNSVIAAPPGYNDDLIDSMIMSCYYFLVDDVTSFKAFDWDDVE